MRAPEKPVGVGGVSRVELWIVPADARGAWTSELPMHGGRWQFSHQAEIPGAGHRRRRAGQGPAGAQQPAARRGDQADRHRHRQRPRLASLLRRHAQGRSHQPARSRFRTAITRGAFLGRQQEPQVAPKAAAVGPGRDLPRRRDGDRRRRSSSCPDWSPARSEHRRTSSCAWIVGGIACLCGALVYAELASRYPETGGEYTFLRRGFGEGVAFVFAWSRMTVIQTGAIAAVSFVFGEYASADRLASARRAHAIWAAICVIVLTGLNLAGTLQSKTLQKVMEVAADRGLRLRSRRSRSAASPSAARTPPAAADRAAARADDDLRAATPSAAGTRAPTSRARCATRAATW